MKYARIATWCAAMIAVVLTVSAVSSTPASTRTWTGLRAQGQAIVDQYGHNVLLRGFGPGEWTNTEAYMIRWPDQDPGAGRHQSQYGYTAIHNTVTGIMGQRAANQYWYTWRAADVTEADIARMQAWGANSLRLSINYHWLSPSDGVYLASGWQWIDQVIAWCKAHNIRVILCLHAAPGAQSNYLMADTPDITAHLWTQPARYQPWAIHLWQAIAQRYVNEPYVAGYDLLDEPIPPAGRQRDVRPFYVNVTRAIRTFDPNHMIFVEGLNVAGDPGGMQAMLPPWDNNMVLVFHKYWDSNDQASIQGYLRIRNQYNVPLWNGETGENTALWLRNMAKLLTANNIGWNSWTYKKLDDVGSSAYSISHPPNYDAILKYVRCLTPTSTDCRPPSQEQADTIMLQLAKNAATANCTYESAVITALFGDVSSFALSVNPISATVRNGFSTGYALSIEPFGFRGIVRLSVNGLPAGATASFTPSSVRTSGTSVLQISTRAGSTAGIYALTITGTSSTSKRNVTVPLVIQR